ncbi:MAG: MBL fold metallo-hydrolase [Janthinobacterium lividum]
MRIGGITVSPLIDGEIADLPTAYYTNVTEEDWQPYAHLLDECTGGLTETVGGFLVRSGDRLVVVDTGSGPQPTFPFVGGALRSALAAEGVRPSDVTDVVFTHLHVDHIGWATVGGKPFFPNATYRVDRRDWDHFMDPGYTMPDWEPMVSEPSRDQASVRLAPVADRMEFFEGDSEIFAGLRSVEASGHTPGSTVLEIESDGERGLLIGDLVHALPELLSDKEWDFFAHVDGRAALESIDRIVRRLVDERLPFAGSHFTGLPWLRLDTDNGHRVARGV